MFPNDFLYEHQDGFLGNFCHSLKPPIARFWPLSLAEGSLQGDPHRALNAGALLAPPSHGVRAVDAAAVDAVAAVVGVAAVLGSAAAANLTPRVLG
jgi:hypothetical protein